MSISLWMIWVWLGAIASLVVFFLVAEVALWCFRKLDDYFRERYMRIIMENMCRLEDIADASEEKTSTARNERDR